MYHENLSQIHFIDGIHLSSDGGIAQYVCNLKEVINPLLGVKNDNKNYPRQRRNLENSQYERHGQDDYSRNYQDKGYGRYNRNWSSRDYKPDVNLHTKDINMRLLKLALEGWK